MEAGGSVALSPEIPGWMTRPVGGAAERVGMRPRRVLYGGPTGPFSGFRRPPRPSQGGLAPDGTCARAFFLPRLATWARPGPARSAWRNHNPAGPPAIDAALRRHVCRDSLLARFRSLGALSKLTEAAGGQTHLLGGDAGSLIAGGGGQIFSLFV